MAEEKKTGRPASKSLFDDGTYSLEVFHDTFIRLEDMTEYKPAIELCGSWKQWQQLKQWFAFAAYVEEWKEELEILLRSRACEKIQNLLANDDVAHATQLSAAKFMSESGWKKRAGAGRPSKSEVDRERKMLATSASETKEERERMLQVINGGKE